MCYWEVIQARPKMQSVRWQSKQTHGWKHTEIKKPKLDFSPHGPTLEVDASENLWDIVFSLLLPFSSQRKSCLQLIKTMSKEGRNSYNTVLSFSSVRELARNGKHEPQPSRKYRPEHMKVTMKEMYLTGIRETRGFTLPLYDILALKNCSTNNFGWYLHLQATIVTSKSREMRIIMWTAQSFAPAMKSNCTPHKSMLTTYFIRLTPASHLLHSTFTDFSCMINYYSNWH